LIVSILAVSGTLSGSVPIVGATLTQNVQILQALLATVAVTMLILAATIAQRDMAEKALRVSEQRLRGIFESSAVGIAVAQADGRIVDTNPAYQKMLGYSAQELRGKELIQITHPDDVPDSLGLFNDLFQRRIEHYEVEKRYWRKNGETIWVHLTASPIRDSEGSPEYAIGVFQDVTARRQLEVLREESSPMLHTNCARPIHPYSASHSCSHPNDTK
jgi:PAS domain S-box-containing protein